MKNVSKSFDDDRPVLENLSLTIESGQFTCILGPSGCGKSTLLRLVAGLESSDCGSIHFGDDVLQTKKNNPSVAFVFQQPNLLPWRRTDSNVALPLELVGIEKAERYRRVHESLALVGLNAKDGRKFPYMLSGGMQMRASLARAIVTRPKVMLLDEPFAALDEVLRQQLNQELKAWSTQEGWTILFVTHNVSEAVFLGSRAIVMDKTGSIVKDTKIQFTEPRNRSLRSNPEYIKTVSHLSDTLWETTQ